MEGDKFYVHLEEPSEFRRIVLLCTKDMLHALRTYEEYKKHRIETSTKISEFHEVLKEMTTLNNKLKRLFPKVKLKKAISEAKIKEKKTSKSKVALIEKQLDEIESKLREL